NTTTFSKAYYFLQIIIADEPGPSKRVKYIRNEKRLTDDVISFRRVGDEAIPLPTWKKIDSPGELADEEMMIDIQNIAKVAAASKGVRIPYSICFTDSKVIKEVQWKRYKLTAIQILMMIQKTNTSIMRKKEDWSVINRLMKYDFDKRDHNNLMIYTVGIVRLVQQQTGSTEPETDEVRSNG
ncbi:unnamed protein product, partial [Acanthoscelides obtectus]